MNYPRPTVIAVLAFTAVLASASAAPADAVEAPEMGTSAVGNYLAGRHAQYERETGRAAEYFLQSLSREPKNEDLLRRGFLILAADGQIDQALALARRLVAETDDNTSLAILALAIAELKRDDIKGAGVWINQLPESGLSTFFQPLMRAWLLAAEDKFDEALEVLAAKSTNKGLEQLYGAHEALINDLAGRPEAALAAYDKVNEQRQNANLRLTQLIGGLYERLGRNQEARAVYDEYMREHANSTVLDQAYRRLDAGAKPERDIADAKDGVAEALFSLAGSLRQQDNFETMLFTRLALYLRPDFDIAILLTAEILESDERYVAANDVYRSIGRASPFAWTARLRVASNFDQLEQTDKAEEELRALADERPDRYDSLVSLGDIMRRHERYREAADAYGDALKRIPELQNEHWRLMYVSGIAHERLKEWDQAESAFLKALELEPDQPFVLNYLGYSWVELGKNLDEARGMIEKAVEKRPTDGYIVDSLGWVLYRLGDLTGAVKQLERAVELRPEDPTINDHLGDVYWHVGRRSEARFQWEKSLHLEPDEELEAKIRAKLKDGLANDGSQAER